MSVSLRFLGAAQTVTGSKFLVDDGEHKVMVDAGLFQGDARRRNWEDFPENPKSIDAVLLTHAHLDHCGYLPLLVRQGFSGPIICTSNTAKLAEVILRDSARIQVEDAKYAAKEGYSKHTPPLPLYDEADVEATLGLFQTTDYHAAVEVGDFARAIFRPTGHILGSSFVELQLGNKRMLFTGDMGRAQHPILVSPDPIPGGTFDAIITESTYGDRIHETPTDKFAQIIKDTVARRGSVLIPAFAVDRTEVILWELRELMHSGQIPLVPVFADSPMALASLSFYRDAIATGAPEVRPDVAAEWQGKDPFDPGKLHELLTVDQSKSLNDVHEPCIIVSASGMATGGRVVHHLAHMLPNSNNTVILVGFQAAGTRGRALEQGNDEIRIHGAMVPVRAEIAKIESFSVHADRDELLGWLRTGERPGKVFVVHGETGPAEAFATAIRSELGWGVTIPDHEGNYQI